MKDKKYAIAMLERAAKQYEDSCKESFLGITWFSRPGTEGIQRKQKFDGLLAELKKEGSDLTASLKKFGKLYTEDTSFNSRLITELRGALKNILEVKIPSVPQCKVCDARVSRLGLHARAHYNAQKFFEDQAAEENALNNSLMRLSMKS